MSKSKNPDAYPYAYYETFKHVLEGNEVRLSRASRSEAEKIRFDMYGYRTALEASGDEFYASAAKITLTIQVRLDGGYDLVIASSLDNPLNEELMGIITRGGADPKGAQEESSPINAEETSEPVEPDKDVLAQYGYKLRREWEK